MNIKMNKRPLYSTARRAEPFDDPHWIFELQHDGIRVLAVMQHGETWFLSRQGTWLRGYSRLAAALSRHVTVDEAILDGVIAAADARGRTRFSRLAQRPHEARFYAFDLVWLNGQDTRAVPLLSRKERLRHLLPAGAGRLVYVQHVLQHGTMLHRMACRYDFRGIIAKRADIAYDLASMQSGWIEIENPGYSHGDQPITVERPRKRHSSQR
jgi:bifunctional non-homologous end joining protein LigD